MHVVSRLPAALAGALALAVLSPAGASADTTLTLARALPAAGVNASAIAPATMRGSRLSLPVARVRGATVTHAGALRLQAGRRTVDVRSLRVKRATLSGRIAGVRHKLARITGTQATLTRGARRILDRRLGRKLPRRLGAIRLDTTEPPAPPGALTITGGDLAWGYNPAIRTAFQEAFAPLLSGGARQTADGAFHLPIAAGAYDPQTRTGRVTATGGFRVGYQLRPADGSGAHGIWVSLSDIEVELDGDHGTLRATSESGYHGTPPVASAPRTIATLDVRGIAPQASADGRTLTWPPIPATIAPGGAELVAAFADRPDRPALGDRTALDPLTIAARLAP